jgi:hypothetical protein
VLSQAADNWGQAQLVDWHAIASSHGGITTDGIHLTEKGIELILTPAAENALVEKGYDPTYGARQLRRTIQKHIEDPLAEAIVRGQLVDSARIEVDVEGGNFVFREAPPQAADAPLELAEH